MNYIQDKQGYLITLHVDEELFRSIIELSAERGIDSAHLWGIGAAKDIVLGSYDLEHKSYHKKELPGVWEIASLTGNLARDEKGPMLHVHGVFSDSQCAAVGGHVFSLTTAATVEIFLVPIGHVLTRKYDDRTGLKLLDLKGEK
jgi:uncharacterized protein